MGRLLLEDVGNKICFGSMAEAIAIFISVSVIVALCAKHTRRTPRKPHPETTNINSNHVFKCAPLPSSRSPLASPRKLVATISNLNKKLDKNNDDQYSKEAEIGGKEVKEEGGLWQKSILMGEKCRPPEFSGVIFYDSHGNQLAEMPRSPRASPLPSFSFPVVKHT